MAAEDAATLAPATAEAARYRRLCAAFDRVHPLDAAGRTRELDALRASDPDLVDELLQMLAASAGPGLDAVAAPVDALPDDLGGERGYRVLREIGRGGMGRVLLAERADGRFERQVAIKVIDGSRHDADWRRRFAAEREILARLVHPNIVRLLDAGESASGIPYLVMEYVDGEPLDRYLRAHPLSLEQRISLFEQVAAAVAHAHQMLVAHRDIKPGNVLVDREGAPHLLDFGIARLLSQQSATATGTRALTPRYAAPEQVAGTPGSATLDVYQLGVLLYELLAGAPPFAEVDGAALLRAVLEQDPPPPGRAARAVGVADARRIDADLDAICLRALRKEPGRRYPSVDALLADLARWRGGEPVQAHAGGFAYRGRKFLRRHWRSLGVAALLVVLTGGFVWRLNQELRRSERERAVAEQATELIVDVFGSADPSRAQGEELTLVEALDQAVGRLRAASELPPQVRGRVLEAVGSTFLELSRPAQSIALLGESADAFRRAGDDAGQLRALHAQAIAMQEMGRYPDAQAALESVLREHTAGGPRGDAFEAELHSSLANLHQYQRRPDQALAEFDRALAILRAMPSPDEAQLAHTLRNLGDIRTAQGDIPGGQLALLEAQKLIQTLYGPDHPDSIRLLRMLGRNAQRRGAHDEALAHFRLGWERAQRVFTAPHAVRVLLGHPLALALAQESRYEEALEVLRQVASESDALYPEGHPSRATVDNDFALLLALSGDAVGSRTRAAGALAAREAAGGDEAAVAQSQLIVETLDCQAKADPQARERVPQSLSRVLADPKLLPALAELYRKLAQACR